MKNLWLHGIYISIIGVLGFQLWAKTTVSKQAFHQVDSILESNFLFLSNTSSDFYQQIKKQYFINPTKYGFQNTNAEYVTQRAKSFVDILSQYIVDSNNGNILNASMIKDNLQVLLHTLNKIADFDSTALLKGSFISKQLKNDTFWTGFKDNQATYLNLIKNQLKLDEILYLNNILDKTSGKFELHCLVRHRVSIAPKKAILIEGEVFEAEIYLLESYGYPVSGLTFKVNNKDISIKEGVGYYSKKENTTGLKKINVKATIRNPATGESTTAISEFEYHVLPKCSQNCQ